MSNNTKHNNQEIQVLQDWFQSMQWKAFAFQVQGWQAYTEGSNGIVNAPTGSGKTYSLLLPALLQADLDKKKGVKVIWITPIRALAKEIKLSADRAIQGLSLGLSVGIRNGDTSTSERQKQDKSPPDLLITTPESLHLLLARKGFDKRFKGLQAVIVDEWHELLGS
ncbi:MAG: DEAD/DEAH box helicase, partial [Chitinophagales bacterium]